MDRAISRRDFLQGSSMVAAASLLPGSAAGSVSKGEPSTTYPPKLTGLRGSHQGSFEVAHQLAWGGLENGPAETLAERYDLVVVGAGISGLAAAFMYQQKKPQARILLVDNHDDFGGHARRNEFRVDGRTLIGYGGAQTLAEPSSFSPVVKKLLRDLGVNVRTFDEGAYDQEFYRRHGLGAGLFFDAEEWGESRVVPINLGYFEGYLPLAESPLNNAQAVAQMPLSEPAREQLLRLLELDVDQIPNVRGDEKWEYLVGISYREFLEKHMGIDQQEVFNLLQNLAADSGLGIESVPALSALSYAGLPGWYATGLPELEEEEPYIHHFPDGNASIARLLVRALVPPTADGDSMEDVVTAEFDYAQLDLADAPVRLRLNSTVTLVENVGDSSQSEGVEVSYVRDGRSYKVLADGCVLACNNAIVPHLCPELPSEQKAALRRQVRTPILYTNVALRNWRAWKKLGIGGFVAPHGYYTSAVLDFPVSLGDYRFSAGPDEPIIVHLERFPYLPNAGLNALDQYRAGRSEVYNTSFEAIERNTRQQLQDMLGPGGFDAARDIAGITVNRWAHGYSNWYNPLFDDTYWEDDDPRYPHMIARRSSGRIAIANSDAAANAMFEAAVEQAHRAVGELL